MPSRRIEDCHPDLQPLVHAFIDRCHENKIDLLITCTYRSGAEQNALYAQGRTAAGKRVTNAKAGQSAHNFELNGTPASKAIDVVPLVNGKPVWSTSGTNWNLWKMLGALGESVGLEWGGHWKSIHDYPHFQLRGA